MQDASSGVLTTVGSGYMPWKHLPGSEGRRRFPVGPGRTPEEENWLRR